MILTDYYKMQEIIVRKSHRFDCVASTHSYNPFEQMGQRAKAKRFFFYYTEVPDKFNVDALRKADRAISNGDNISSVFVPDLNTPCKAFGDVKGTNDALLFLFTDDYRQVEVFVARGYKYNSGNLCRLFLDGEMDDEIDELRRQASATNIEPIM